MDMQEMEKALSLMEEVIDRLRYAGEDQLAEESIQLMVKMIDRYEAEGGDRTMFDAALT